MEFAESRKGKTVLVYEGHCYRKRRENKDSYIVWQCINERRGGCRGKAFMMNNEVTSTTEHVCLPDEAKCNMAVFLAKVRKRVREDFSASIPNVLRDEMMAFKNNGLELDSEIPQSANVKGGLYYQRWKIRRLRRKLLETNGFYSDPDMENKRTDAVEGYSTLKQQNKRQFEQLQNEETESNLKKKRRVRKMLDTEGVEDREIIGDKNHGAQEGSGSFTPEEPFESVFLESNISMGSEDSLLNTKIKAEPLNELDVPDIFSGVLKTESVDLSEELGETTTTTFKCLECGQNFEERWDLEQHLRQNHSERENIKRVQKKTQQSSSPSNIALTSSLTHSAATASTSTSSSSILPLEPTSQTAPNVIAQPQSGEEQYLLHNQPMNLPLSGPSLALTPPPPPPPPASSVFTSSIDSSDTFFISLAKFPEPKRVGIKKKLVEVVEILERLKIDPEMLIISQKV